MPAFPLSPEVWELGLPVPTLLLALHPLTSILAAPAQQRDRRRKMFRPISYMAGVKAAVTFLSLLVLGACQTMAPGTTAAQKEGYFTTSDNVRLHYVEAGKG